MANQPSVQESRSLRTIDDVITCISQCKKPYILPSFENYFVKSLYKQDLLTNQLISRNFCEKMMKVNFRNFYTVRFSSAAVLVLRLLRNDGLYRNKAFSAFSLLLSLSGILSQITNCADFTKRRKAGIQGRFSAPAKFQFSHRQLSSTVS